MLWRMDQAGLSIPVVTGHMRGCSLLQNGSQDGPPGFGNLLRGKLTHIPIGLSCSDHDHHSVDLTAEDSGIAEESDRRSVDDHEIPLCSALGEQPSHPHRRQQLRRIRRRLSGGIKYRFGCPL